MDRVVISLAAYDLDVFFGFFFFFFFFFFFLWEVCLYSSSSSYLSAYICFISRH